MMLKYFVKRVAQMACVLFVVSILVFFITSVIGNPVYLLVPPDATTEQIEAVTKQLGLDKPLTTQYAIFLKNALQGDFGRSYYYNQSSLKIILERLPATMEIALVSMGLTMLIGVPLGVYAGAYYKRRSSKAIMGFSIVGISLPSFWIGMVLIYVFSVTLGWLPTSGRGDIGVLFGIRTSLATASGWRHVILPAITLSLANLATIIRLVRAGMQENMRQDYVKFARAKGVGNRSVLFGHALKNTMIPVITIFGLQLGDIIAFTTITETIFAWPGIGKLLIDSISSLDRPIVSAYLLLVAVMFVVINFIVDLLYVVVDPRVDLK